MRLTIRILILTLTLTLGLSSCTKNEFDIIGELKSISAQNMRFLYYASDSKKGFVVDCPVTIVDGKLNMHGVTRNPTLVWVIDGQGRFTNIIYAERGDKLEVSGEVNKPWQWEIKGNKTEEELSQWIRQNGDALLLCDYDRLNKAVAAYVNENPESLVSAILLAAIYQPSSLNDATYKALRSKIPEDNLNNPAVTAAGCMQPYFSNQVPSDKLGKIILYSLDGKPDTILAKGHSATLLYFWRKPEEGTVRAGAQDNHKFNVLMLKNLHEQYGNRLQIVDINCDLDTTQWHRATMMDTVAKWTRLWEPGYGMGEVSQRLGVPTTPYMILADSTGSIRFRGYNVSDTENTLKQILR